MNNQMSHRAKFSILIYAFFVNSLELTFELDKKLKMHNRLEVSI
jgi:hypothetical protein